jgi:hypothetical protein
LEIRDLFDKSEIGTSIDRGNAGTRVARESGHMHLINHCLTERTVERRILLPEDVPPIVES